MAGAGPSRVALFAFPEHEGLGRGLARELDLPFGEVHVRQFPDGESLVRVPQREWKGDAVVLCGLEDPNRKLIECLLAMETLRNRGARSITLVAPYLGYMRQDVEFHAGEAVSQKIVGRLLGKYADRLLTVDAHLHRTATLDEVVGIPCRNLTAAYEIGKRVGELPNPVVVGPDAESAQWAEKVAEAAGCPWTVGEKTRYGDRDVRFELEAPADLPGSTAVLVDDIVSTGNTIIEAVRGLAAHAPKAIHLYAVHGFFVEDALERIRRAGVTAITSTNTVAHETSDIDVAGVLAEGLRQAL